VCAAHHTRGISPHKATGEGEVFDRAKRFAGAEGNDPKKAGGHAVGVSAYSLRLHTLPSTTFLLTGLIEGLDV
jgi:hypothetical protein